MDPNPSYAWYPYSPLRRPNFTVAKKWLFSLWKDVAGIKYNTKINFSLVYPVWSKTQPDNWALKQCHNLLWWPTAGAESLAEWCATRTENKPFRRNIIFSFKYKTSHLMAKNTVLWTPIHPMPDSPLRRPNLLWQKNDYFHSERMLLE